MFPFSPIPPYQDECLAVFLFCHNYIADQIIVCVKRVAVCDKQIFRWRFSNTKLETGQNRIGYENRKQQKCVAYCVKCNRRKKNVVNENGKLNSFS
jgi:hypothetical protein